MKAVLFEGAPQTPAHYVPGVIAPKGDTLYISGQLPLNPVTRAFCQGDITEQTLKALENLETIVKNAGGTKESIVRTTAYITTMEHWNPVNDAYATFFGDLKPARTIVCTPEIHFGLLVEIDGIAIV